MKNIKQRNKVKDGEDVKVYLMRAAAKGHDLRSEYGYLMTDEMKLKHGVLWNSMTGEAVGIADDMLDLNSVLKRLVSDEGDVGKSAVYVNAWRYISIGAKKTEGWMCGFFFNEQCAAVLTLGFNKFTRFGSKKLADLRDDVKGEIAKPYEGKVVPYFWLRQQQMQTNAQNNNPK